MPRTSHSPVDRGRIFCLIPFVAVILACENGTVGGAGADGGTYPYLQQWPLPNEICGNGIDDTGDGTTDEGCECAPGELQRCYPGHPREIGQGVCQLGQQQCLAEGVWGPCEGSVAGTSEICDGMDNDCDGDIDGLPGCKCTPGEELACYAGPASTEGVGACFRGTIACVADGAEAANWGSCGGQTLPLPDQCGNGRDDDCNGTIDDGCVCAPGSTQSCYNGPAGTAGVARCRAGTQACAADGRGYGACMGAVLPSSEVCDGVDNDCDGVIDDGTQCGCPQRVYGGHTYLFCTTAATWSAARASCASKGYHLVSSDNAAEDGWLLATVNSTYGGAFWIGLNDLATEGSFVWDGGSTSAFRNWHAGEPNNTNGGEDCVLAWWESKWLDALCNESWRYICESR